MLVAIILFLLSTCCCAQAAESPQEIGKVKANIINSDWHQRRAIANVNSLQLPPIRIKQPQRITGIESELKRRTQASLAMQYHNGPVMHNPTIYVIFYGPWSSTAKTIVYDFLENLSGSAYYGIQTTYYDPSGPLDDKLSFTKETNVYHDISRSQGKVLTNDKIQLVVTNAILSSSSSIVADQTGIYLVLADSESTYTDTDNDFCTDSCGYHGAFADPSTGNTYAFGIIVDPSICGTGCSLRDISPNGNPGVDAMLDTVAHEIVEAASDPYSSPASWYNSESGYENADTCVVYGNTYTTSSGAEANVRLGARDFLIQQNWVNGGTSPSADTCQMALPYLTLAIDNTIPYAASSAISISWTANSAVTFPLTLSSSANNAEWTIPTGSISPHLITLSSTPYDNGVDGVTTLKLCDSLSYCSTNETIIASLTLSVIGNDYVVASGSSVSYSWSYAGSTDVATSPLIFTWYLNGNYYSTITATTSSGIATHTMPSIAGVYSYKLCDSNGACATPVIVVVGTLSLTATATTLAAGSNLKFSWSSSGISFPLTLSIWDSFDTIFYAQYDVPSTAASGTLMIKLPSFLWLGDYHMWLCDANMACASFSMLTIALPLAGVQNKADLLVGETVYTSFSSADDYYMAYAIWSDAPISIYMTDGTDCDATASSPLNFYTKCSHDLPISGYTKCTKSVLGPPMCLYIICEDFNGCTVSYNVAGYASNPGNNAVDYIASYSPTSSRSPSVLPAAVTPSVTPSAAVTPSITPSAAATPSITSSATATSSITPLVTPSTGTALLRLSLIFSGSSGTFTAEMQSTIIASAATTLEVPPASIGWLGVTDPSSPGISRRLISGVRVQLSVLPSAASLSSVIQASLSGGSGNSLSSVVTSLLSSGFNAALASQPGASALAFSLGYGSTAAMVSSLSLDSTIPITAVVMSATPIS